MPRPYYIFKSGTLRRKENTLYLESPGEGEQKPIPVEDVEDLYLFGEIELNARLLNFLGQKGIPLHLFNYYGFYTGTFYPRERNVSGFLLVKQVEHYLEQSKRLYLAREMVQAALHNLKRNLLYYRNRGREIAENISSIEREEEQARTASSIAELMGVEGRVRESYYRAFNQILELDIKFTRRVRRPPDNMINALLSFGNSLMYAAVLREIYVTQLNPTISYLHEPSFRRYSLALDIAEIFKPMIVDKLIFKLLNTRMLEPADFDESLEFCYLQERGRKVFVREFDAKMETTVKHRKLGRNVSYRRFLRLECYRLIRHLTGMESYKALRAWW
jgi:CRISPR-associated protein Cas1